MSERGRGLVGALAYLLGWTLLGLAVALRNAPVPSEPGYLSSLVSETLHWLTWGLLSPWIYAAVRQAGRHRVALAVALNLVYGVAFFSLVTGLGVLRRAWFLEGPELLPKAEVLGDLLVYLCITMAIFAYHRLERSRGRAIRTSTLEAQLAQARLQALKAQLHPHFLFNTLNAISALMHRDVDSADRMIALLSDLLRVSLDKDERHQVSLKDELGFLERYLAIERIRFRDRLTVDIDIEAGCGAALVPRLILQPLVENSIIHGIALQSTAGLIAVKARRKGNRLEVSVADDGPGLLGDRPSREGVGLSNTRARLAELYGAEHRVTLERATEGGLRVSLEMPFEHKPRFPVDDESSGSLPAP